MSYLREKNKKRLIDTFIELVKILSLSKKEKIFSKYLAKELKTLGCGVFFDSANKKFDGEVGNLIAKFPGRVKSKPFLLCCHADTVNPGRNIKPRIKKGRIVSGGKTVLGADCKAGIAIILEVLKILKEHKLKHPPIEIVITQAEELGLLGSKNLEHKKLKARCGITLDNEEVESLDIKSPKSVIFEINITGKPSHSGVEPQKGVSAIKIACDAMTKLKLGRIDTETVCNINLMQAGCAVNTIAPSAVLKGDIRSHNITKLNRQIKRLKLVFDEAAKKNVKKIDGKIFRPKIDFKIIPVCSRLKVDADSYIVKLLKKCARKNKVKLKLTATAGGSDANILCGYGILAPNLGVGARKVHTTGEYLITGEFFKCAEIVTDAVVNFRD